MRLTGQFTYRLGLVPPLYPILYQSLNQRWSASQGVCPVVGVFFQAIHANALLSCGVRTAKRKNPINHSAVLALGESNNKRLKPIKSSPVVRQDHTEIYGVLNLFHRLMPLMRDRLTGFHQPNRENKV